MRPYPTKISIGIAISILLYFLTSAAAQDPAMTSWVSDADNQTEIQLRTQYYTINGGYTLIEVSFSMSAARCALTDQVRIYIYQNDGSGTYGTVRHNVAFDPGPGSVPFAASDKTRILVFGTGGIDEPIYARAVISGEIPANDFVLTTPDCLTRLRTSDSYDPNETSATASTITSGTTHEYLVVNNDEDWYPAPVTPTNPRLVFNMSYWNDYKTSESNLDLDLFLIRSDGYIIASSTSSAASTTSRITETIDEVLNPSTYYMVVRPKDSHASRNFYRLNWDTYEKPTYQISGYVRDDQNNGIQYVNLGGLPGSPVTDANGYYEVDVEHDWSGTVTPILAGYTFDPVTRTYTDVQEVHLSDNYTATLDQFTISGRITNGSGSGEPGITLNGFPEAVVTDAEGYYSVTIPYNWSGTIIPSSASLVFSPVSYVYSEVRASIPDQDYTSSPRTYTLSGNVISSTLTPLEGVSMGGFPESVVTNAAGVYTAQVEDGWSGTITPSLAGYTFAPVSQSLTNVSTSQIVPDFVGTLNTYEISGNISVSGGGALSGVTLTGLPGDPVTDVNGDYTAQVDHGWSGTVTPGLTGYTFDPVSSTYSSVAAAQVQDYTATPNTHQIDGYVRDGGGSGIAGVLMSGLPGDPVTNASGYYSGNVSYGSNITVTPTLAGYSFVPASTDYIPVLGDASTDYTGTRLPFLNVDQHIILLGTEAGSQSTVNVTSNVSWTVTCPESWITCSPESGSDNGSFTVTANAANTGVDSRDATLTVSGGGITRNIGITQSGSGPVLEVSPDAATLDAAAGSEQTITISSNQSWTVSESADWLIADPASGTGNGTLTLTAASANEQITSRSTTVSVSGGGFTRNIDVTQSGADPMLEVSGTSVALASAAGSNSSLSITSNIDWTVSESADWLSVAPASGTGDGSLTITADQVNTSTSSRNTTVTLTGSGITRNINVSQSGADPVLELSSTSETLASASGSNASLNITSNIDWTVSESADWLSVAPASGSGDATLTLTATSANDQASDRSTIVTVSGGGLTRTLNATQSASGNILEISLTQTTVGPEQGLGFVLGITSNISWTASTTADWLSVTPNSGTGDGTIHIVTTAANEKITDRLATVTVTGSGITRTFEFTQTGGEATLDVTAPTEKLAPESGSQISINLLSNIDWTTSVDDDWLTVTPSSGSGNQELVLVAQTANEEASERSTTLHVDGGGLNRYITVTQSGQTTGIRESHENIPLEIYPNPARDKIHLVSKAEKSLEIEIKVLSIQGKILFEKEHMQLIPGQAVEINLSNWSTGQYILQVRSGQTHRIFSLIKYE